jgi:hypothetical protein
MGTNKYCEKYIWIVKKLINDNIQNNIYKLHVQKAFEIIFNLNLIKYFDLFTPDTNTGYLYSHDKYLIQIMVELDKQTEYKLSSLKIAFVLKSLKEIMGKVS